MNVWKMNLKDNRDEIPENLKQSKFIFCREKGIVGIGWVGYDESVENTKDIGYEKAKNNILSFRENDLVWVKNPETKEYYLCKIKSQVQYTKEDEYNKNDISMYCECDYQYIGTADNLPKEIQKEDLVSIPTISKVSENVSNVTLSLYNSEKLNVCTNPFKEKIIGVYETLFKKHRKITISVLAIFIVLLTITITTVNIIHKGQKRNISELLTNKIFVSESDDFFSIMKFNDKGERKHGYAYYSEDKKSLKNIEYGPYQKYEIKISFCGKRYLIDDLGYKYRDFVKTDRSGSIVSIDSYVPINEDIQEMLNKYYKRLEDEEKEKKKKENEENEIKSYLPNKDEFYERVLQVFPEVGGWQLFGNSNSLYMDPNNSKNFMLLNETSTLTFNDGSNKVTFINSNNRIMVTEQKGKLTEERYNQLIKMAFGDAPDNLKICDLVTFKQLTDTEGKVYPTDHSAKFKGMTYRWYVSYSNGAYNGYNFFIDYK